MADEIEKFLSGYSDQVQESALVLRDVIRKALPKAHEKLYTGWKSISYSIDGKMKTMICGICPHKAHVNLQLSRATELEDSEGLLKGTGKSIRHIKIEKPADAKKRAVSKLIKAAAKLIESS